MAATFDYSRAPVAVPDDLIAAHETAWDRLRHPGAWWSGAERIEIAAEVRNALDCDLCRKRKSALSPRAGDGLHGSSAVQIGAAAVDAVHRLVTDAARSSAEWIEELAAQGVSDGHYVELLGVVVTVLSIDEVHRGLGIELAALPEAVEGRPTNERPAGADKTVAWVPTLGFAAASRGPHADLYAGMPIAPNVIAAMSLVPDAVRQLKDLSRVHYVPLLQVMNPSFDGRALNRSQIELVAGRVSALNECFY